MRHNFVIYHCNLVSLASLASPELKTQVRAKSQIQIQSDSCTIRQIQLHPGRRANAQTSWSGKKEESKTNGKPHKAIN